MDRGLDGPAATSDKTHDFVLAEGAPVSLLAGAHAANASVHGPGQLTMRLGTT